MFTRSTIDVKTFDGFLTPLSSSLSLSQTHAVWGRGGQKALVLLLCALIEKHVFCAFAISLHTFFDCRTAATVRRAARRDAVTEVRRRVAVRQADTAADTTSTIERRRRAVRRVVADTRIGCVAFCAFWYHRLAHIVASCEIKFFYPKWHSSWL